LLGLLTTKTITTVKYKVGLKEAFAIVCKAALSHGDVSILGTPFFKNFITGDPWFIEGHDFQTLPSVGYFMSDMYDDSRVTTKDQEIIIENALSVDWSDSYLKQVAITNESQLQQSTFKTARSSESIKGVYHSMLEEFKRLHGKPHVVSRECVKIIIKESDIQLLDKATFFVCTGAVNQSQLHVVMCSGTREKAHYLFPAIWFNDIIPNDELLKIYGMRGTVKFVR